MSRTVYLFILVISLFSSHLAAQERTGIFDNRFKTLKVTNADNFMSPPVIRLGTEDRLIFTFDEIGEDNSWLQYRLVHCNADWRPSRLVESEYLDGFNIADIEDFAFSSNTFIHFVNYRLEIPNENIAPLVSGNYLLQVFDRDNPDETLLQARFMVTENAVAPAGTVSTRTDRGVNDRYQQLTLAIDTRGANIGNPWQDITVTVTQNVDIASTRTLPSPSRVAGDDIIYDHNQALIFPAGNEYRRFENVSTGFPGMNTDSVKYVGPNYHVWVTPDHPRADTPYNFDRTQHGRFLVREFNASDSDLGADYVTVHFTLNAPRLPGAEIYVDGEMTHGVNDEHNRMTWNDTSRCYRLEMPLKQGSYNYRYLVSFPGKEPAASPLEGDKYETENEYSVAVYYHPPGSRADRLIGFTLL